MIFRKPPPIDGVKFLSVAILLYLVRNKATGYGGAIAIPYSPSGPKPCFFTYGSSVGTKPTAIVTKNNTAGIAGDVIFGGAFEICTVRINGKQVELTQQYFNSFFRIMESNSLSAVASIPYKICVCQDLVYNTSELD